jgi:hypothetical protein
VKLCENRYGTLPVAIGTVGTVSTLQTSFSPTCRLKDGFMNSLPGTVGNSDSLEFMSFQCGILLVAFVRCSFESFLSFTGTYMNYSEQCAFYEYRYKSSKPLLLCSNSYSSAVNVAIPPPPPHA